jgi:hypothetical protein
VDTLGDDRRDTLGLDQKRRQMGDQLLGPLPETDSGLVHRL